MQHRLSSLKKLQQGFTGIQVMLIVLAVIAITTLASFYIIKTYIFPSPFTPVTLDRQESHTLNTKLAMLGWELAPTGIETPVTSAESRFYQGAETKPEAEIDSLPIQALVPGAAAAYTEQELAPQPYHEHAADRVVSFSEKEINAIIGRNPDFAHRVAIDFSKDLASAAILVSIPRDFPVMPGQTLRVSSGLNISLDSDQRPVISLKGISLMGVPLPNAWLGNTKDINLVNEFGDGGFWTTFADGVEYIAVSEGVLNIKLKP